MARSPSDLAAPRDPLIQGGNPFVPIGWPWRYLILTYVIVYNILAPGVGQVLVGGYAPLMVERLLAEFVYQVLLFLPLFFYRPDYGWLHPLVFPVVFDLAAKMAKTPEHLLVALLGAGRWLGVDSASPALAGMGPDELAYARLNYTLIKSLALVVYYAAFFWGPRIPLPRLAPSGAWNVHLKALTAIALSGFVLAVYLEVRGGLSSHLLSFAGGRFQALGGDGPLAVVVKSGTIAFLIWYALDRGASFNPLFWMAAMFTIPVGFVVQGSRSAVLYPVVVLLMVWMLRHGRLPAVRSVIIGICAFALFGALGQIRNNFGAREVNWEVITRPDLASWLEAAKREADRRSEDEAGLTVIAKGPEAGLLYGRTYLAAVLFWVPRALWEDKPRGVGAYNAALLFRGQQLDGKNPKGGGIPPGPVAEAFWNFHIPGVVVVFALYGVLQQWLARLLQSYPGVPAVWVIYSIMLLYFAPGTTSIISCLHALIPAIVFLYWMGAIPLRPAFGGRQVTDGSAGAPRPDYPNYPHRGIAPAKRPRF